MVLLAIGTNASLVGNVVIPSVGTIAFSMIANSGLAADIQTAVNTVNSHGGGTVYVPAGNWTWNGGTVTIPAGVNVIGAGAGCQGHENGWENYTALTILHNIHPQGGGAGVCMPTMFQVNTFNPPESPTVHRATRISGIRFEATPPVNHSMEATQEGNAISIHQVFNFRVDHCTFINFCGFSVSAMANSGTNRSQTSYGLVDHCFFSLPYKTTSPPGGSGWEWGYGVYAGGAGGYILYTAPGWTLPVTSFFGQYGPAGGYTICYVEDCHFRYFRHCTDTNQGGYICSRFNLEESPACLYWISMSDVHGNIAGGWQNGGRGQEVYNCTFIADTAAELAAYTWWAGYNTAINLRGGAGLFYYNDYTGNGLNLSLSAFVTLSNGDDINSNPAMAYWDNGMDANETYIWDNTYTDCPFMVFDYRADGYNWTQNVNYFLRVPSLEQDGFTYTPYLYPHPLTLQGIP